MLMRYYFVASLFTASVLLSGCSDVVDIVDRVKASEERIKILEEKVEYLSGYISDLESTEELMKQKEEAGKKERRSISSMFGRSNNEE